MLQVAKKIFNVPIVIYQSFVRLFSGPEFTEKEIERVNQIVEKIVNGDQLKKPYYEKNRFNSHQDTQ